MADLAAVQHRMDAIDSGGARASAATPLKPAAGGRLGATAFARMVLRASAAARVDPSLVAAVARTESGLDPLATSRAGAQGIMQLMPATAQALGVADPYDPAANIRAGARYLRELLGRFGGDVPAAVAAYNAGPAAVERYGGVPPFAETRRYVARVMEAYRAERGR